ncbi:MAG: hypothetical protein ACKVK5_06145 [Pseudomonadales bacterium]
MKELKVLDCTLRDGGYYNNWDFSLELTDQYLEAIALSGVDYVELGLRNYPSDVFKGANAFTTEEYLSSLKLPVGPKYGVMVDAKTILSSKLGVKNGTSALFTDQNKSKLYFVRVAAHYTEISGAIEICTTLKKLGYFVGLNLMQSAGKSTILISEAAKVCETSNSIDVLYFADSLGNMNTEECLRIIKALKAEWSGELGIHAHDNTSQALSNSIFAAEQGVTFLDSTITGMGRGAGNVKTEILLTEIRLQSKKEYSPNTLYRVVLDIFEPMQRQCGWGTSLLYHVGAKKAVHPTYIQQLISESRFSATEKAKAIEYLGSIEASNYSYKNLEMALTAKPKISSNTRKNDSLEGQFSGKEILLIGAGPSTNHYQAAIRQYISKIKPVVISININNNFNTEEIDYYAISHNIKFFNDSEKYDEISKKIIAPISRFEDQPLVDARNYGLQLSDTWNILPDQCSIPYELTAAYALALCVAGNAASVTLTGFDGYDLLDERNKSVQDTLNYFNSIIPIQCLTPTNYRVRTGSIYAI